MTQLAKHPSARREIWRDGYVSDAAYVCDGCGRYSVVTWRTSYDPTDMGRSGEPEHFDRKVAWSPPYVNRPEYCDVPEHIAKAAREAWLCHGHEANVAACALARAVVEASAKERDVTERGIERKINALKSQGAIWGDLVDAAHVVRQFGNDASHGDLVEPATHDEARDVLDIMDELLHQLFTSPARSKRLKESREGRS